MRVECEDCGAYLTAREVSDDLVIVERCQCRDDSIRNEAYEEGYEDGAESAYQSYFDEGYDEGCTDTKEEYEDKLNTYQTFLDRIGINYNPEVDEVE